MSFPALPPALLLLVHLHLLGFEARNGSDYNEDLFTSSLHGGGERIRTMEEVAFFLVGRIEGTATRTKKILSTYPCARPSDTLAFRNALTKYMELLKYNALHPTATTSKDPSATALAWWWKDVIVRKSLLEECCGDRFLRLLLALSTHALLQRTPDSDASICPSEQDVRLGKSSLLDIPNAYTSALSAFQSSRTSWETAATRLNRRQDELNELRRLLENPATSRTSKYSSLATDKLLGLHNARIEDLLRGIWSQEGGNEALYELFEVAGLNLSSQNDFIPSEEIRPTRLDADTFKNRQNNVPTPALPIAAAHHPKRLRHLTKPVLCPTTSVPVSNVDPAGTPLVQYFMSGRLAAEAYTENALTDALVCAERDSVELQVRSDAAKALAASRQEKRRKGCGGASQVFELDLWSPSDATSRKINAHIEVPSTSTRTRNVQARVDRIRDSLKTSWPPVLDTQLDIGRASAPTRLPQATVRTGYNGPVTSSDRSSTLASRATSTVDGKNAYR